jgi:hypothetical protein
MRNPPPQDRREAQLRLVADKEVGLGQRGGVSQRHFPGFAPHLQPQCAKNCGGLLSRDGVSLLLVSGAVPILSSRFLDPARRPFQK